MSAPSHLPRVTAEMRWLSTFGSETISDPLRLRCSRLPSCAGHCSGKWGSLMPDEQRPGEAWLCLGENREVPTTSALLLFHRPLL